MHPVAVTSLALIPMNWRGACEWAFFAVFITFWLCGIIYFTVPITSSITGAWDTTMSGPYYDVIHLCDNFNDTEARCASERYLCGGINNRVSTRMMVRVSQCLLLLIVQLELDVLGFFLTAAFVYYVGIGFARFVILDRERRAKGEGNHTGTDVATAPAPKHTILMA
jgi:hypothetical protein